MNFKLKLFFYAVTGALLMSHSVQASLLAYDPFLIGNDPDNGEYVNGAALQQTGPTVHGFTGVWGQTIKRAETDATGLSYTLTDNNNFVLGGVGGSVVHRNAGGTGVSTFTRSFDNLNTQTTPGERWFSAMFLANNLGNNEASVTLSFDSGSGLANYNFGLRNGNLVGGSHSESATLGTTYLMIGRLVVNSTGGGQNETVDLWINPTDASSVSALDSTALHTFNSVANYIFEDWGGVSVGLAIGGADTSSGNRIDEIRYGESLIDVAVIPEPGTLALVVMALAAAFAGLKRRRR